MTSINKTFTRLGNVKKCQSSHFFTQTFSKIVWSFFFKFRITESVILLIYIENMWIGTLIILFINAEKIYIIVYKWEKSVRNCDR